MVAWYLHIYMSQIYASNPINLNAIFIFPKGLLEDNSIKLSNIL